MTPLKTPAWTAEVIFSAEVRPKCYKVSQSRWKRKKRGLETHTKDVLYSNHTETIIKNFVTNLNNHKTQNRSGHLVY